MYTRAWYSLNFRCVTGGEYKAQVRVHRGVLIHDHYQVVVLEWLKVDKLLKRATPWLERSSARIFGERSSPFALKQHSIYVSSIHYLKAPISAMIMAKACHPEVMLLASTGEPVAVMKSCPQ